MTYSARFHLDEHLTWTRVLEFNIFQGKRCTLLLEDSLLVCLRESHYEVLFVPFLLWSWVVG
jgi:hypothetical protein